MAYMMFNAIVTIAYVTGLAVLVHEMRTSTKEARRENQSIPLLLASTVAYAVVLGKTYQLALMCGWI